MINIPATTPLGKPINTIGLWMSGGADSALLCYMLAEKIKNEQLTCKIQPITIDYKRPFMGIAENAKDKVIELLDCPDLFLPHIVYHPPEGITWGAFELAKQFHIRNYEHFKDNKIQALFSGITTNPPVEVQEQFLWGILGDVEIKRGTEVAKEKVRYFEKDGGEFLELKPFFDVDKQELARIYNSKGLLDSLFPLTRSCEDLNTVLGHCGECWWCEERQWAFGRLE
jgi:3'-phosphoadenosine 5'-phosphosulfate sulfotransferase (PAPS reductase)/FAD synthetase